LNIDVGIKNKRKTYRRGKVNEGHEGEGIWLRVFIYIKEIEQ
jgi:hypothetical protein